MASNTSASKSGRGRKSSLAEARELVALLGALSREGDSISVAAIQQRLGITEPEAQKLLDLVISAGGEDGNYLSLYSDDDSRITLTDFNGITKGKPLRLTADETNALHTALDVLGVAQDDPLRIKLNNAFGSARISLESIKRTLATALTTPDSSLIQLCAQAISQREQLTFLYLGNTDAAVRTRLVAPIQLWHTDTNWYLDARDLANNQERTFKLEKIQGAKILTYRGGGSSAEQTPAQQHTDGEKRVVQKSARMVTLHFSDPYYLSFFDWPGLNVISKPGRKKASRMVSAGTPTTRNTKATDAYNTSHNTGGITAGSADEHTVLGSHAASPQTDSPAFSLAATIPYYGKNFPWLARRLAACGGSVTTTDPELQAAVQEYICMMLTAR
jgi:predicted DNA-binding transcriptional regulator YafY